MQATPIANVIGAMHFSAPNGGHTIKQVCADEGRGDPTRGDAFNKCADRRGAGGDEYVRQLLLAHTIY